MNPPIAGTDPAFELPDELISIAAKTWCRARRLNQPSMPALHELFTPLGLDMVTAGFDSLLCLVESATGRPMLIGTPDEPSADEIALCALLGGQTVRPADRGLCVRCVGPLSLAIECAASSILLLAASPSDAI